MSTMTSRWQLNASYTTEEIKQKLESLQQELDRFQTDQAPIRSQLVTLEQLMCQVEELSDFVYCLYAEDVSRQEVLDLLEQTDTLQAGLQTGETFFEERLRTLSNDERTTLQHEEASYYLTERRAIMERRLPAKQEQLIQALAIDGFSAWEQLYEQRLTGLRLPLHGATVTIGQAWHQAVHGTTNGSHRYCEDLRR